MSDENKSTKNETDAPVETQMTELDLLKQRAAALFWQKSFLCD
jgi:hypothetical protein